ncbi:DMT family transporter [Neobacillus terrae]|uniref:DMT family transporter n=1 Tax=Neobacillus terrae TaxID=3034837 RepID=UPI00140BFA00|nr:EamA family transporter [Neobacillus terrae]NHM31191.1 EamA family transporter [Neobacillus terrae]
MKQSLFGGIYLSLAAGIWGGTFVVSKYVLDYIPPFTLIWIRYLVAFVVLFLFLKITGRRNKSKTRMGKQEWLLLIWLGFIGYFVSIALQFIGTKLSDAHTGAIITSSTPAFMVLFARFILKESLTLKKIISLLLASLGVVTIIGWDVKIGDYLLGCLILVGAAVTWALLSVYVKVAAQKYSSLYITTWSIFFALLFTTPAMAVELQNSKVEFHSSYIILGILYLGVISTAVAFFLWNKGLELMDAGVGSLFFFFQPFTGTLLGWLLLDEKLNSSFFLGGFMILAAVLIVSIQSRQPGRNPEIEVRNHIV